jgi:ADP-ribose pyrophosphatase
MDSSVTINSSTEIYQGRVFKLVKENIVLPNGAAVDIDVLRHPGAAAMVALTENNEVVLIRQYRHAVGEFIWEIPAGTLDPEEGHGTCAHRELEEETGYRAERMEKIGEIVPVPGYSNEKIHVYLATGLSKGESSLDHDEYLSVHRLDFDKAVEMIEHGEICDAKTIFGLLKAKMTLSKRGLSS